MLADPHQLMIFGSVIVGVFRPPFECDFEAIFNACKDAVLGHVFESVVPFEHPYR